MPDILEAQPTRREYGPPREPGVHRERHGFTAMCACLWVRWEPDQKAATEQYAKHVKGCKVHGVEAA